ncbi:MAG: SDR family NAD(P)-dependent oxidoreductase [Silvibacterium sp.]|nr:SDR family NAD(P)-dependent oxidoreductase [Silvibacterium sp.]
MRNRREIATRNALLAVSGVVCAGAYAWCANARTNRLLSRLRGKVVLITGSSRGLGLALAEEFGRNGAKLVLTARDTEELERAGASLIARGAIASPDDIVAFAADLRNPDKAERLVERATAYFGRIDVLVNNAGIITVGPLENQTLQTFRDVMDANFFTAVHCALAVLPQMLARGEGSIINITSIGGKVAVPHLLPYTASKFAAVGFSEGLNAELRSKGIRVTTVCPGLMRTGSHRSALFTGDAEREYRWFSLGAALPGTSISARSAARKIVRAAAAGANEISITPQAMIAARLNGVAPTIVMTAMRLMNAMLPAPTPASRPPRRGTDVREKEIRPAVLLGEAAARRYNQIA